MPMNTYSDIASYVQTIFEDAMFVARASNVVAPIVTGFSATGDATRTNSLYGTATINALAETDDLTSQAFTPAPYQSLTPGEFGGQVFLTDRRIDNDPSSARNDASQELGMAMAQKIDTDLIADFANFTGGTLGAGGSLMTWGRIFAAEAILNTRQAPGRYRCVMSPYQFYQLGTVAAITGTTQRNAPGFQDRVQNNMQPTGVFSIGNIDIVLSANIPTGTASVAAMFSQAALALDTRRAPRLEPERDASRRGWELNMSAIYAHGVWRPEWGVKITADSSIPTGT